MDRKYRLRSSSVASAAASRSDKTDSSEVKTTTRQKRKRAPSVKTVTVVEKKSKVASKKSKPDTDVNNGPKENSKLKNDNNEMNKNDITVSSPISATSKKPITGDDLSLFNLITDPSWQKQLKPLFENHKTAKDIQSFLEKEWLGKKLIFPMKENIFEAFNQTPFDKVKVVLLGQDPYHDDGQAHGLAFSVPRTFGSSLPPSLKNIYKELERDIEGFKIPNHGCLEDWTKQGVLLLNAALTVEAHQANSHSRIGWHAFTDNIIEILSKERDGLVFLLWGNFAHKKEKLIDTTKHTIIKSSHPSPLSFARFFGCKCFSQANKALVNYGKDPIDWSIQ